MDACGKDSKPRTRRIEKLGPEDFALSESMQRFKSIAQLIAAHQDPESSLYLNECLPPSEYGALLFEIFNFIVYCVNISSLCYLNY